VRTGDRFAPRTADLDLVLYDELVIDEFPMRVPDPELLKRAYLAVTTAEVSPGGRHPETGERLSEIAARLNRDATLTLRRGVLPESSPPRQEEDR
jgi:2-amino-4-hydroxy-6-hydroxymethyldihydropteridine diphosphokinase